MKCLKELWPLLDDNLLIDRGFVYRLSTFGSDSCNRVYCSGYRHGGIRCKAALQHSCDGIGGWFVIQKRFEVVTEQLNFAFDSFDFDPE